MVENVVSVESPIVNLFVSYAHGDEPLASGLIDELTVHQRISARYRYRLWRDTAILVGENWDKEIREAMAGCDAGLLLVSPRFFGSKYVTEVELKYLLDAAHGKVVLPVMLRPVLFDRQDLKEVEALQIFRHQVGMDWRAFGEMGGGAQKEAFARGLFVEIEARLEKHGF